MGGGERGFRLSLGVQGKDLVFGFKGSSQEDNMAIFDL